MTDLDTRMQLGAAYRRDPLGTIDRYDAYRRLDPANAHRVDGFLARHGGDENLAMSMRQLIESDGFGAVSPEVQASLLDAAADHPDAGTMGRLRLLAADEGFQNLAAEAADAEIGRVAAGVEPGVGGLMQRSGVQAREGYGFGVRDGGELLLTGVHFLEGVGGVHVAEAIVAATGSVGAAATFAGAGAAASIYGVVHQIQHAHEEGRAIGGALQQGSGFVARLAEHAGFGESTPRTADERRGAAAADRCWRTLSPSTRVALQSENAGRVFGELQRAILERAAGGQ